MIKGARVFQKISNYKTIRFINIHKKYLFPAVVLLIFIILVSFKISGTSIGVYNNYLYGSGHKDSSLLYGKPQPIRSDEWLVSTQLTIAQEKNGFKELNQNFVGDKDMSIVVDVPYLNWSMIFKPQNLAFFILPLEYAFAFKWWILLVALLLSAYYFTLRLLPGKIIVAILLSIIISYSPFVFWWYQTATIAPLAYGFLILILSMNVIDNSELKIFGKKISSRITTSLRIIGLSYLLTSFALILYPPFQIPIAISVAFFLIGYLIQSKALITRKIFAKILFTFISSIVIVAILCATFVVTRRDAVSAVANTVYPGSRSVSSGGYDINQLLVPYLQPQIQRGDHGDKYIKNKSESSAFILTPIFLLLPAIGLSAWLYLVRKRFDWVLIFLILCNLLFLAQLFIPGINIISKLLALNLVPLERLQIGLGFVAIPLLVVMIKVVKENKLKMTNRIRLVTAIYLLATLVLMVIAGFAVMKGYPDFISSKKLLLGLLAVMIVGIGFVLFNRVSVGLFFIAALGVSSVIYVNPLYVGLGPIYNSQISQVIQRTSDQKSVWAAAQDILIENLPQMSGQKAVTGVAAYPDISFWKDISNQNSSFIYNRYAHTVLSNNDSAPITLVAPDFFSISLSCGRKVSDTIDYVVSTTKLTGDCYRLINSVTYPSVTFYIYKQ